jgi:hypothetical protein
LVVVRLGLVIEADLLHRGELQGLLGRERKRITAPADEHGVDHEEVIAEGPTARTILAAAEDVGAHYVFLGAEEMSRTGGPS